MEMNKKVDSLLIEIEKAFPFIEMPSKDELMFHAENCEECRYLRNDIEKYREKKITGEFIRLVHQELSLLSVKTWGWLLPYYLRFCLTPEAEQNQMEIEYLIYNLSPKEEFTKDTILRLSFLSDIQVLCLIHFLEWLLGDDYWGDYFKKDISAALAFLRNTNNPGACEERGRP